MADICATCKRLTVASCDCGAWSICGTCLSTQGGPHKGACSGRIGSGAWLKAAMVYDAQKVERRVAPGPSTLTELDEDAAVLALIDARKADGVVIALTNLTAAGIVLARKVQP